MSLVGIERLSLVVADLPRAVAFYRDALGFTPVESAIREGEAFARLLGLRGAIADCATLALGAERIELLAFRPSASGDATGRPYPADSTSADLWFQHFAIIVDDIEAAYRRVAAAGGFTPISEDGPVRLPEASGGATAWKFRDPDGHPLELLMFPPGKAPAKWRERQAGQAAPFLGIDHSAIAVADTGTSEAFYTGLMALSVASRSLNVGVEQERLDRVFNARVEVTGLALPDADAPHIELLCYRVPATGRPIPVDARADDIAATSLVIAATGLAALVDAALRRHVRFVSCGLVALPDGGHAASLRDPDGHLLVLTARPASATI